jgi:hypothetical protein
MIKDVITVCSEILLKIDGLLNILCRMKEVTNELLLEVLESMQLRLSAIDRHLKDLLHGQILSRDATNSFQTDAATLDTQLADVTARLERLEAQLNLNDA